MMNPSSQVMVNHPTVASLYNPFVNPHQQYSKSILELVWSEHQSRRVEYGATTRLEIRSYISMNERHFTVFSYRLFANICLERRLPTGCHASITLHPSNACWTSFACFIRVSTSFSSVFKQEFMIPGGSATMTLPTMIQLWSLFIWESDVFTSSEKQFVLYWSVICEQLFCWNGKFIYVFYSFEYYLLALFLDFFLNYVNKPRSIDPSLFRYYWSWWFLLTCVSDE